MSIHVQGLSSFGRRRRSVNYSELSDDEHATNDQSINQPSNNKSPSIKLEVSFTKQVKNTLGDAVSKGMKLQVPTDHAVIISAKQISKIGEKYYVSGKCISNNNGKPIIMDTTVDVSSQQAVFIVEILTNVKDIDSEEDILNLLWKQLTKNFQLPNNYLHYKIGDSVFHRPAPSKYNRGKPMNFDPVLGTITAIMPHTTVGDLSPEYEIEVASNEQNIQGGAVHESFLRPSWWKQSKTDSFDTTPYGIMEYETQRAIDYRVFDYLKQNGLTDDSYPYFDVESAYFNHKLEYIDTNGYLLDNTNMLNQLFRFKMQAIIDKALSCMKPADHGIITHKKFKKQNELLKFGKTVECCEIQVAMNLLIQNDCKDENKDNENNSVQVSHNHVWLMIDGLEKLLLFGPSMESSLSTTLKEGTTITMQCSDEYTMQFEWNRKSKLLCLNDFHYLTQKPQN